MAERNTDYRHMENHLYNRMYEVLNSDEAPDEKISKLNGFKAKIMRLHANRTDRIILDQASKDKLDDEPQSLFHPIKQKKRCEKRTITAIQGSKGEIVTDPAAIFTVFETFLQNKYEHIEFDSESKPDIVRAIQSVERPSYAEQLEKPITEEELLGAIRKGSTNKAPGVDGFGIEFYKMNWETIGPDLLELMNNMFLHQMLTPQQRH
jgi:hypothetical protein